MVLEKEQMLQWNTAECPETDPQSSDLGPRNGGNPKEERQSSWQIALEEPGVRMQR